MLARLILPGVAFALTLALGFWLSLASRPYNGLLFNVHKLVALGAVIAIGWEAVRWFRGAGSPAGALLLAAGAALLVIALFASGALLSMGKLEYALVLTTHRLAMAALVVVLMLGAYWAVRVL
jgi:hypothetical protein